MPDTAARAPARALPLLPDDVIDAVARLDPNAPLAALRRQRADARRHTQGSFEALFEPVDAGSLARAERELAALRIATLHAQAQLAALHRARAEAQGADAARIAAVEAAGPVRSGDARFDALVAQVDRLTRAPAAATPAHLEALIDHGYAPRDLVALAQLVGFVNYQVRLLAGLRLLGGGA